MTHLEKDQYPTDFYYHRTASPTYRDYLGTCGLTTFDTRHPLQYAWCKKIFGDFFGVIKYERIVHAPDIEFLKRETGLRHAFVVWIPYGQVTLAKPWRRLWATDHFEETGYAKLEYTEDMRDKIGEDSDYRGQIIDDREKKARSTIVPAYLASWNERSRRARKKYLTSGATVRYADPEEFAQGFRNTKVKHWHKSAYISYYKRMVALASTKVRQWLAYDRDGKVIGGLAVHDFLGDHSVHLVAFTDRDAYEYQAGTGLMDAWFADSYEKHMKYLSMDHLRNKSGPRDQRGYTAFKENFLTAELSFKEAYFRVF